MKKLVSFLFLAGLLFVACDKKEDQVIPTPPPPPPPPPQAEITIKFGALPPDCLSFKVQSFGFFDESGKAITSNLKDETKYPEFTYKFSAEFTKEYIGKKITLYLRPCRVFPPGFCWDYEVYEDMTFQLEQSFFFEIPPREE
jgi:hypothetical protein